jgi:hypothetical protein
MTRRILLACSFRSFIGQIGSGQTPASNPRWIKLKASSPELALHGRRQPLADNLQALATACARTGFGVPGGNKAVRRVFTPLPDDFRRSFRNLCACRWL